MEFLFDIKEVVAFFKAGNVSAADHFSEFCSGMCCVLSLRYATLCCPYWLWSTALSQHDKGWGYMHTNSQMLLIGLVLTLIHHSIASPVGPDWKFMNIANHPIWNNFECHWTSHKEATSISQRFNPSWKNKSKDSKCSFWLFLKNT